MQIQKLTAVPSTPTEPNALFLVSVAGTPEHFELYASSKDGSQLKRLPNKTDIEAIIKAQLAGIGKYKVVANISERDGLPEGDKSSVYVKDATADGTVKTGGAFYLYDTTAQAWIKVSEAESLDVSLSWDSLTGKPTSSPSQIDNAVNNAHTHSNQSELNKIGQDEHGNLTYDGKSVGGVKLTANW